MKQEKAVVIYNAFKEAYKDVPCQDNEGYTPDRGSFKTGFYSGWKESEAATLAYINKLENLLVDVAMMSSFYVEPDTADKQLTRINKAVNKVLMEEES